jgi:hypothetical protein
MMVGLRRNRRSLSQATRSARYWGKTSGAESGCRPSLCMCLASESSVVYADEIKDPKDVILSAVPVRLGPKDLLLLD